MQSPCLFNPPEAGLREEKKGSYCIYRMPPKRAVSSTASLPASRKASSRAKSGAGTMNMNMDMEPMPMPMSRRKSTSQVRARKTRPARPEPTEEQMCLRNAYSKYHEDCGLLGDSCSLVQQCKDYGVGSHLWPASMFRPLDENFPALTSGMYGKRNVHEGKQCMSRAMWADQGFRDELDQKCPGNNGYEMYLKRIRLEEERLAAKAAMPPRSRRSTAAVQGSRRKPAASKAAGSRSGSRVASGTTASRSAGRTA